MGLVLFASIHALQQGTLKYWHASLMLAAYNSFSRTLLYTRFWV